MNQLYELRKRIDIIDLDLINLFKKRAECIQDVIEIKKRENLPARIEERVDEVLLNARKNAQEKGLDPDFAEHIWRAIIEWAIAEEEKKLVAK